MKKKVLASLLVSAMAMSMLAGCGSTDNNSQASQKPAESQGTNNDANNDDAGKEDAIQNLIAATSGTVELSLWCSETEAYQTVMAELVNGFKETYKDVTFDIKIGACSEANAKDEVLKDPEAAADVFVFADDQVNDLVKGGALQQVATTYTYDVSKVNSAGTVNASSVDGKLYAYPLTASNGYFLFYDKSKLTDEDVASWEALEAAAAKQDAFVGMNMGSGWYVYGWFQGAGLALTYDGNKNTCNWNAEDTTPTGAQVAAAVHKICTDPTFVDLEEAGAVSAIKDGKNIIAFVSGTWNAADYEGFWGEGYAATKLPTFNVEGKDYQMASYAGYKLVGVNPYTKQVGWAMLLAEYISSEASQSKIAAATGEGPANTTAASTISSPALSALGLQSAYATQQIVGNNYWGPAGTLGKTLATPGDTDWQKLLNETVDGITQ